jgi:hypothetical protein
LQIAAGFANSIPNSSSLVGSGGMMSSGTQEIMRLKEELAVCNLKLVRWKEGIAQARNVCAVDIIVKPERLNVVRNCEVNKAH